MWKTVFRGNWRCRIDLRYSQKRQTWSWRFKFFWHVSEKSKVWKSQNGGNEGCWIDLRYFQGPQTWSYTFKIFWHMTEKSKMWKSLKSDIRGSIFDLKYFQRLQMWSLQFKIFWHVSEKSKMWNSLNRAYWVRRIDLKYFWKRPKHPNLFPKKEKYRYKGKNPAGLEGKRRPISEWWRKKADTRSLKKLNSFGAKRRIQGCYSSGSKEKWGCFLN